MKMFNILFSLITMTSFSAFADDGTRLDVKPIRVANCAQKDYDMVTSVYNKVKVSEDTQTAVYSFFVVAGPCKGGNFYPQALDPQAIDIFFDRADARKPVVGLEIDSEQFSLRTDIVKLFITLQKAPILALGPVVDYTMYLDPGLKKSKYGMRGHTEWLARVTNAPNGSLDIEIKNH